MASSIFFPRRGEVHSILYISDGIFHPSLPARRALQSVLQNTKGNDLFQVGSLSELPKIPMKMFQAVVLYFHDRNEKIPPAALDALDQFVLGGGGLLAVHAASASFPKEKRYHEILGGRFVDHGPVETYRILPAVPQDEIFGQTAAFTIRDELYVHEVDIDNRVHFTVERDEGNEPVVWTRQHGEGRVCYCAPGHKARALLEPSMIHILQTGLQWVRAELPPELRKK